MIIGEPEKSKWWDLLCPKCQETALNGFLDFCDYCIMQIDEWERERDETYVIDGS